ncbi:MAG: DUF3822 family protein [Bacteroidales bacterium]|nr:DUF3822 family protein [Bacteroidales bacterium]
MSLSTIPISSNIDKALNKEADIKYSEFFELSIQFSLDGFSFCIYNNENNKLIALESYAFQELEDYRQLSSEINDLVHDKELLKRSYKKINIIFESPKSTLIPFQLFDKSELHSYLKFNHNVENWEIIRFDSLKNLEAKNIYVIPKCINKTIKENFGSANISNFSSSLIESLLIKYKNQNLENKVFVNLRSNIFDIIIIEGKKLKLFNSFKFRTKEDFAYFLLFALEQLKFNPEEIELIFTGAIEKSSNLYEIIYKYIRNIAFIESNDLLRYSYIFDNIPLHLYYNLLNINLCEL